MSRDGNFNLDKAIKDLKKVTPRAVTSLEDLQKAHDIFTSYMSELEGKLTPQYLYKISDKEENFAYLLGTQHVTDAMVFCEGLLDIIRECRIFVTEVQLIDDKQENAQQDKEVDSPDPPDLKLPIWAQNMSRYDQNFLKRFFKEYRVKSIEDASPHKLLGLIQVAIFEIMAPNGMDKQLAEYFKKQVEQGKLSWLENSLDREKAEQLQHPKEAEATDSSAEDKYYINIIDQYVTFLCDAQNHSFLTKLLRKILGIETFTHDTITSTHKYLKGEVKLDQDQATDHRTANWIQKIDDLICGEDNAFIAVGVQHLLGENGILDHFKDTHLIEHIFPEIY